MGIRDRLRLLVRPGASAPAARSASARPEIAVQRAPPAPVSIPRRVTAVPEGAAVVEASWVALEPWAKRLGPVVVVPSRNGDSPASAVAERLAALGAADVSWLAGEAP